MLIMGLFSKAKQRALSIQADLSAKKLKIEQRQADRAEKEHQKTWMNSKN